MFIYTWLSLFHFLVVETVSFNMDVYKVSQGFEVSLKIFFFVKYIFSPPVLLKCQLLIKDISFVV